MRLNAQQPLFAWEALEDSPSLQTVRAFLETVPDASLLDALRRGRGKGRDDDPVRALWGTLLLTIVLCHPTIEAGLAGLQRNAALRKPIGIESEAGAPKMWNKSRFLDVLGREPRRTPLRQIFDTMIRRLGAAAPDLGRQLAGDASRLGARLDSAAADDLPGPSRGHKEYADEDAFFACADPPPAPPIHPPTPQNRTPPHLTKLRHILPSAGFDG